MKRSVMILLLFTPFTVTYYLYNFKVTIKYCKPSMKYDRMLLTIIENN